MKISVCIPTYEMAGHGAAFLLRALESIKQQTIKDLEVVVSDHSENEEIRDICKNSDLDVKYLKNSNNRGSSSANINNAVQNASGDYIKILFQDDYLCRTDCLEKVLSEFESGAGWVVVGTIHTTDGVNFYNPIKPKYHEKIYLGENTISSPSVIAIKNEKPLLFDEKLSWLMDVEYYKRLYDKYGLPNIVKDALVVNTLWEGQISNTRITKDLVDKEVEYVRQKHE